MPEHSDSACDLFESEVLLSSTSIHSKDGFHPYIRDNMFTKATQRNELSHNTKDWECKKTCLSRIVDLKLAKDHGFSLFLQHA